MDRFWVPWITLVTLTISCNVTCGERALNGSVTATGIANLTETTNINDKQGNSSTGHEIFELEKAKEKVHVLHSTVLLIFVVLLIFTVVIIWLSKRLHVKFLHETSLTILLGMSIGAAIRYGTSVPNSEPMIVIPLLPSQLVELNYTNSDTMHNPLQHIVLKGESTSEAPAVHLKCGVVSETEADQGKTMRQMAQFNPELFFSVFLPPILFSAGYNLERKYFFRNIGAITFFAFLGTAISCAIVGFMMYGFVILLSDVSMDLRNCLYFGALISCTDPLSVLNVFLELKVEGDLFALVFGESTLNDAVGLVLSETIGGYQPLPLKDGEGFNSIALASAFGDFVVVFLGSLAIGIAVGYFTAALTKFTRLSEFPSLESPIFILLSYSTYLMAEAASFTGIVAILFCGIVQAHYTYGNLSEEGKRRTQEFFEMISFMAENFVMGYMGISLFTSNTQRFYPLFIVCAFASIAVGRTIAVFLLSAVLNVFRKSKIPIKYQVMMTFAGLRGPVALAIAAQNTDTLDGRIIFSTTSVIVLVTVVVNGGLTELLLGLLKIKVGVTSDIQETLAMVISSPLTKDSGRPSLSRQHSWKDSQIGRRWYDIDKNFLKPLFTHSQPTLMETVPRCAESMAKFFTSSKQQEETKRLQRKHLFQKDQQNGTSQTNGEVFVNQVEMVDEMPERKDSVNVIRHDVSG